MHETKPFYLTSEFWVTIATIITALAGVFPASGKVASLIAGAAAAAYALSRGLAKSGVPAVVPVAPPVAPRVGTTVAQKNLDGAVDDSITTTAPEPDQGDAGTSEVKGQGV